jgi:hypothetical protein
MITFNKIKVNTVLGFFEDYLCVFGRSFVLTAVCKCDILSREREDFGEEARH